MKRIISILFLILYSIAMLKPVMPFIDYYINYTYISTKLCENIDKPQLHCNGKCYLNKLIKTEEKEENNTSNKAPSIDISKYPVSLLEAEKTTSIAIEKVHNKIVYFNHFIVKEITSKNFKPPQLV